MLIFASLVDEKGDEKCEEVLGELENIDEEAHDLKISFVKISDTRLAKKYGVKELPALVYFRKKYPAIYRGLLEHCLEKLPLRILFRTSTSDNEENDDEPEDDVDGDL